MYSTLHDVIRDVERKKERKKERKAPEAMETCTVHYMYSTSYVHV